MLTVTLDTNALPAKAAFDALGDLEADVATTTVTAREVEGTRWADEVKQLNGIIETWVMGDSTMGGAHLGSEADRTRYEGLLMLLSNGSFPKPGQRGNLTNGWRRMMRDAMILSAHAREDRQIFVSNDVKAIGVEGSTHRRQLHEQFGIRAVTLAEFNTLCERLRAARGR